MTKLNVQCTHYSQPVTTIVRSHALPISPHLPRRVGTLTSRDRNALVVLVATPVVMPAVVVVIVSNASMPLNDGSVSAVGTSVCASVGGGVERVGADLIDERRRALVPSAIASVSACAVVSPPPDYSVVVRPRH
jgi:hypothetical protein